MVKVGWLLRCEWSIIGLGVELRTSMRSAHAQFGPLWLSVWW